MNRVADWASRLVMSHWSIKGYSEQGLFVAACWIDFAEVHRLLKKLGRDVLWHFICMTYKWIIHDYNL